MAAATIEEGALVCAGAVLEGSPHISRGCVIHPSARILGEARLGEGCVVEEGAVIAGTVNAGKGNLFQCGCRVECQDVGDYNNFMPKCYLGPEVRIGSGCTVGATVALEEKLGLSDGSSVALVEGKVSRLVVIQPPHGLENNVRCITYIGASACSEFITAYYY